MPCKYCAFSITGNTASRPHFQAFLLEGISRWNVDRVQAQPTQLRCYSYKLLSDVQQKAQAVLGMSLDCIVVHGDDAEETEETAGILLPAPREYTGKLQ